MNSNPMIDPRVIAATRGLEVAARKWVTGLVAGMHSSRRSGFAREFSQYRAYQPGDDTRHIDWKLFARSDRYFLRESDVDTTMNVRIVLDATESMAYKEDRRRKFDDARILAAAFACLAAEQGDPVGLHTVRDGHVESIQPGAHRQPFRRIVYALEQLTPAGKWTASPRRLSAALAQTVRAPGDASSALTIILTDGHEHSEEIRNSLLPLRARRHEVLFVHLTGHDEASFPYTGLVRFEEIETGRIIEADAGAVRTAYLGENERWLDDWRRVWRGDRFDYCRIGMNEPLDRALRSYLRRRARRN
ncbi:MAG TPA: DUF58 domain-containing protein [Chthoniobacterales bacterium]